MHKNNRTSTGHPELDQEIEDLLKHAAVGQHMDLFRELVANVIRLGRDHPQIGDLKQTVRAFRELRVAHRVFSGYRDRKKVTIFGSARTPKERAEYKAAHALARQLVESGFMVITGAGEGIMGAAQAGAGAKDSFGLNIILPFEQHPNETIQGDPKLITFKYFFTRKLHFVKESHAVVCFPGGFGTMDEAFETLTLIQTGKGRVVPVVLVDVPGGSFWKRFEDYLREELLGNGLVSESDFHLFRRVDTVEAALAEVVGFYHNFHSYRFIQDAVVIRLNRRVPDAAFAEIAKEYADICVGEDGGLVQCDPLPGERGEPGLENLPRVRLRFNRKNFGRMRQLLNALNQY
jgi:uncharacterized protein (TIGR00730 family)